MRDPEDSCKAGKIEDCMEVRRRVRVKTSISLPQWGHVKQLMFSTYPRPATPAFGKAAGNDRYPIMAMSCGVVTSTMHRAGYG